MTEKTLRISRVAAAVANNVPAWRPESVFAVISILFGLVLVFTIPPLRGADEGAHTARILQIAGGGLRAPLPDDGPYVRGTMLPRDQVTVMEAFRAMNREVRKPPDQRQGSYTFGFIFGQLDQADDDEAVLFRHGPVQVYPPTLYAPAAVAAAVLRPFDPPPLLVIYATRIATLIVTVALLYAAIRIAPAMRWTWCAVALLPTATFIRSTASGDNMTTAFVLLFVASVLAAAVRTEPMSWGEKAALAGGFLLLCLTKVTYVPLVLLMLSIPAARFGSRKAQALTLGAMVLPGLVAYLGWSLLAVRYFPPTLVPEWDMAQRMRDTLHDPFGFLAMAMRSFVVDLPSLAEEALGVAGWTNIRLPGPLLLLAALTLAGSTLVRQPGAPSRVGSSPTVVQRGLMLAALLASLLLIYWALLLAFTHPGSALIDGVQGRYFVPLLPVLLMAVSFRVPVWRPLLSRWPAVQAGASVVLLSWTVWAELRGDFGADPALWW